MEEEISEPGLMDRKRREKGPTFSEALVPFRMTSSTTIPNTSRSKASAATGSPSRDKSGLESAIRIKSVSRAGVIPYSFCVPDLDLTNENPTPGLRPDSVLQLSPSLHCYRQGQVNVQGENQ